MNGDIVIIVMGRGGKVVDSKVFQHSKYPSDDKFENAIARRIDSFERMYKGRDYVIHQGSSSNVASFLTVYPELARK